MEYVSLYELQRVLKEELGELFPDSVWVCAELASVQVRSGGHCYLELVESSGGRQVAKVKAIIWASRYPMLSGFFKEATGRGFEVGQKLLVRAQVSYSELYGMSLIIDDVNPEFTVGEAELEKQKTIDRLVKEDLMDRQKELALSALPRRLAVISAPDAAGYGDFCRHLSENEYGFRFEVKLFPATMQGSEAPASICGAMAEVDSSFDAVLILRGGGSPLDLACFDDYSLCRAIALCPLPVFTAIGHDRDYHVADMVAWQFVKTPTALADEFIGRFIEEDERITALENRLRLSFLGKISLLEMALERLASRIEGADPRAVLQRGYVLVADEAGVVVKKAEALETGSALRLMFSDGQALVRVETVEKK